jgi:hypothetical protein
MVAGLLRRISILRSLFFVHILDGTLWRFSCIPRFFGLFEHLIEFSGFFSCFGITKSLANIADDCCKSGLSSFSGSLSPAAFAECVYNFTIA